jgi:hypothetical protein
LGRYYVNLRIILKYMSKEYDVCGPDSSVSGYGPLMGYCEYSNESSVSVTGGE